MAQQCRPLTCITCIFWQPAAHLDFLSTTTPPPAQCSCLWASHILSQCWTCCLLHRASLTPAFGLLPVLDSHFRIAHSVSPFWSRCCPLPRLHSSALDSFFYFPFFCFPGLTWRETRLAGPSVCRAAFPFFPHPFLCPVMLTVVHVSGFYELFFHLPYLVEGHLLPSGLPFALRCPGLFFLSFFLFCWSDLEGDSLCGSLSLPRLPCHVDRCPCQWPFLPFPLCALPC